MDVEHYIAQRARLAAALREARKTARMTGIAAADASNLTQPTISKFENGKLLPSPEDLGRLLDIYRAPAARRKELIDLAARLRLTVESNRAILRRGAARRQHEIADVEAASRDLRYFAAGVVPGLAQTAAFMTAMFSLDLHGTALEAAIAARQHRQRLLQDPAKRVTFLLGEAVARWRVADDATMAAQLDRLAWLSKRPNIRLGVIPFSGRVSDAPLHDFQVFDETLVTVALEHGVVQASDARDVAGYLRRFHTMSRAAVWGDKARALITTIRATYIA